MKTNLKLFESKNSVPQAHEFPQQYSTDEYVLSLPRFINLLGGKKLKCKEQMTILARNWTAM